MDLLLDQKLKFFSLVVEIISILIVSKNPLESPLDLWRYVVDTGSRTTVPLAGNTGPVSGLSQYLRDGHTPVIQISLVSGGARYGGYHVPNTGLVRI